VGFSSSATTGHLPVLQPQSLFQNNLLFLVLWPFEELLKTPTGRGHWRGMGLLRHSLTFLRRSALQLLDQLLHRLDAIVQFLDDLRCQIFAIVDPECTHSGFATPGVVNSISFPPPLLQIFKIH
jgi:hypothetical protein